jgi:tripartite-type tricarboxylate transporter receptor subunit TctC
MLRLCASPDCRNSAVAIRSNLRRFVVTSHSRRAPLPDLPMAEPGYKGIGTNFWYAAAPAKTPNELIANISEACFRGCDSPLRGAFPTAASAPACP